MSVTGPATSNGLLFTNAKPAVVLNAPSCSIWLAGWVRSAKVPALPVRLATVNGPPVWVIGPVESSLRVAAVALFRLSAPAMLTELDLGAGAVAPAGTSVNAPTSRVPPLVWMIGSRSAPMTRRSVPSRLVLIGEAGASSTVPAVVLIALPPFPTTYWSATRVTRPFVPVAVRSAGTPGTNVSPGIAGVPNTRLAVGASPTVTASMNRLLAVRLPTRARLVPLTTFRSPPVTTKPPRVSIVLPVPSRLTLPFTPPLLVSEPVAMILVGASVTGPADVMSMELDPSSFEFPVIVIPPAPLFRAMLAPCTKALSETAMPPPAVTVVPPLKARMRADCARPILPPADTAVLLPSMTAAGPV